MNHKKPDVPAVWHREARNLLKGLMAHHGVGFKALSRALEPLGIDETPKALSNRINRGTFSLAFFLQCMQALGVDTVQLANRKNLLNRDFRSLQENNGAKDQKSQNVFNVNS